MTKKKGVTVEELNERLNADPSYVAREARKEAERQDSARQTRIAESPLVDDLRGAGYAVESAWDLVNTAEPYPGALPILFRHLQRSYPDPIPEGIARAMAVPDANFAWPTFVELYHREGSDRFKEGLAVALAGSAHPKDMENLLSLIRDPRNGESRLLLLLALERSKDPWAENVLRGLQGEGDPQLAQELGLILKRFEQKRKRRALRASSKKRDKGC